MGRRISWTFWCVWSSTCAVLFWHSDHLLFFAPPFCLTTCCHLGDYLHLICGLSKQLPNHLFSARLIYAPAFHSFRAPVAEPDLPSAWPNLDPQLWATDASLSLRCLSFWTSFFCFMRSFQFQAFFRFVVLRPNFLCLGTQTFCWCFSY